MLASETSPTILKIVILLKNQWEEEGRSGEGYLQFSSARTFNGML
ncbi:hypothetical protein BC792_10356 [Sphingobacterium allocomposti]|uniref:Uncharacterized protein n=1 Tax=Sphingobacterium allocomposti TaxID=415956 RepID=A0A5S5DMH0_9SPHI|nr:hypothetical protein BC792_10356 [Sphingobacterium composti Yoo et al. 2007 non Ten et al. 2007]